MHIRFIDFSNPLLTLRTPNKSRNVKKISCNDEYKESCDLFLLYNNNNNMFFNIASPGLRTKDWFLASVITKEIQMFGHIGLFYLFNCFSGSMLSHPTKVETRDVTVAGVIAHSER